MFVEYRCNDCGAEVGAYTDDDGEIVDPCPHCGAPPKKAAANQTPSQDGTGPGPAESVQDLPTPQPSEGGNTSTEDAEPTVDATDSAIEMAADYGIDVTDLAPGSGKDGRVLKGDVREVLNGN